GEIVAGRGFWPGLSVSLKHNSRFASFTILAKGAYPAELDIPIPFSLISNDEHKDELVIMPAYWFLHNMYALARNSWKYPDRDRRIDKTQLLEYDFLAPDTIGEMTGALTLLRRFTGLAAGRLSGKIKNNPTQKDLLRMDEEILEMGRVLLEEGPQDKVDQLEILAEGWENNDRKVKLIKVFQAYALFRELIAFHAANQLLSLVHVKKIATYESLLEALPGSLPLTKWVNVGGQLIRDSELQKLLQQIRGGKIREWGQVHEFYIRQGENYAMDKLAQALAALKVVSGFSLKRAGKEGLKKLLQQAVRTKEWMTKAIYDSRAKDYSNPFRKMVYDSPEEMNAVVGPLAGNSFIRQEKAALRKYQQEVEALARKFKL
ncbi:MAG: DUF4954 domain-containing protein, partial [Bacteroidota bacterium]